MREFETGATRNDDSGKFDYEGFLSPLALERFGAYMHKHRVQADGKLRDSDNWQRGIPPVQYLKSLVRHVFHLWKLMRGGLVVENGQPVDLEDTLCAILFNTQGLLHERLKEKPNEQPQRHGPLPPIRTEDDLADEAQAAAARLAKKKMTPEDVQAANDLLAIATHRLYRDGAFAAGTIPPRMVIG